MKRPSFVFAALAAMACAALAHAQSTGPVPSGSGTWTLTFTPASSSSSSSGASSSSGSSSSSGGSSAVSTIPPGPSFVDGLNATWTLVSGVAYRNGAATPSSQVAELFIYKGVVYQLSAAVSPCGYWSWTQASASATGKWSASTQPAGFTPITCPASVVSSSSSSGAVSSSGGSSPGSLLAFVSGLPAKHELLSGQHGNMWDSDPMDNVTPINVATGGPGTPLTTANGLWPAILGTTINQVDSTEDGVGLSNQWCAAGGIVQVSMWPNNPYTGNDDNTRSGYNFPDIYTPGTALNTKWNAFLDAKAAQMKAINCKVLFRPFGEVNGSWSWWGGQPTAQFVALYRYTWARFKADGVTNALWIYNSNCLSGGYGGDGKGNGGYYPGADEVDIVSEDCYPPAANDPTYTGLIALGKPFIFSEVGVINPDNSSVSIDEGNNYTLLQVVKTYYPLAAAVIPWCQNYGLPQQQGELQFMQDPAIVNRSAVPHGLN